MKKFLFLIIASSLVASAAMAKTGPNTSEDCSKVIAEVKRYKDKASKQGNEGDKKDGQPADSGQAK